MYLFVNKINTRFSLQADCSLYCILRILFAVKSVVKILSKTSESRTLHAIPVLLNFFNCHPVNIQQFLELTLLRELGGTLRLSSVWLSFFTPGGKRSHERLEGLRNKTNQTKFVLFCLMLSWCLFFFLSDFAKICYALKRRTQTYVHI